MSNKTLTAFTPAQYEGAYPPYFNVCLRGQDVVITVRGPCKGGKCGETTSMKMTPSQFAMCLVEIEAELQS